MWITLSWFFHYLTDGHVDNPRWWMNWPRLRDSSDLWSMLWKYLISPVVKHPVHGNCSFSKNVQKATLIPSKKTRKSWKCVWIHSSVAACQYGDSSTMQLSENTCAAMPALRHCRGAPGFSFLITRERAAPCTPCFPLVFPSWFHGLRKFCAEVSAWLQSLMFSVCIPTHTSRVVQPPCLTEKRLPSTPCFRKENAKKMQWNVCDAQISQLGKSFSIALPCFPAAYSLAAVLQSLMCFFSSCAINSLS